MIGMIENLCRDMNSNNNMEGLLTSKGDYNNERIVMIRGKMIIKIIKITKTLINNNPNSSLHSSTNTTKYQKYYYQIATITTTTITKIAITITITKIAITIEQTKPNT